MSEEIENVDNDLSLEILQLHLPDPDQSLFIERWKDTDTFHGFSELPVELRLKIWRFTFPDMRIASMHPVHKLKLAFNGEIFSPLFRKRDPLPIALYINHESREEALRFYRIFHQEAPPGHDRLLKPLCFNSSTDGLFINARFMFGNHIAFPLGDPPSHWNLKTLVSELTSQHPKHMSKLRILRIDFSHIDVDPLDIRTMFNKNAPNGDIVEGHPSFYSAFVFNFPALDFLIVDYCVCDSAVLIRGIMDDLKAFLAENLHRFRHGKIPKIYIVKWDVKRKVLAEGFESEVFK